MKETQPQCGYLFGDKFAVLGRDSLLQRRNLLLELRDFGDVVGVAVAALAPLLLRQLGDLGQRLVRALDLRHVRPLWLLVVVVLVPGDQRAAKLFSKCQMNKPWRISRCKTFFKRTDLLLGQVGSKKGKKFLMIENNLAFSFSI